MQPPTPQTTQTWEAPPVFTDYDDKYKLCCCHIRNWANVVGVLELVYLIWNVGSLLRSGADGYTNPVFMTRIIAGVIWVIVLILLFEGIRKERPRWLIPHVVCQCLQVIGFLVLGIMSIAVSEGDTFLIILGMVYFISIAIEIFFIYAIICCFEFFSEKRAAMAMINENLGSPEQGFSNPMWHGGYDVVPSQDQDMEVDSSSDLPPPNVTTFTPTGNDETMKA